MKTIAISFLLLVLPAFLLADDKKDLELVKVYCFSEAMEAGFVDKGIGFCKEITKRGTKKKSLVRVESRDEAHMLVEFLSAETVTTRGETTYASSGVAWTPDTEINVRRAHVIVGDFAKEFSSKGINAQAMAGLIHQVEEWIRENRENILEKAKAQQ